MFYKRRISENLELESDEGWRGAERSRMSEMSLISCIWFTRSISEVARASSEQIAPAAHAAGAAAETFAHVSKHSAASAWQAACSGSLARLVDPAPALKYGLSAIQDGR